MMIPAVLDAHIREAEDLLTMAERARNSDNWRGNRNEDSLAMATVAQAHATMALVGILEAAFESGKLAVYNANAI